MEAAAGRCHYKRERWPKAAGRSNSSWRQPGHNQWPITLKGYRPLPLLKAIPFLGSGSHRSSGLQSPRPQAGWAAYCWGGPPGASHHKGSQQPLHVSPHALCGQPSSSPDHMQSPNSLAPLLGVHTTRLPSPSGACRTPPQSSSHCAAPCPGVRKGNRSQKRKGDPTDPGHHSSRSTSSSGGCIGAHRLHVSPLQAACSQSDNPALAHKEVTNLFKDSSTQS